MLARSAHANVAQSSKYLDALPTSKRDETWSGVRVVCNFLSTVSDCLGRYEAIDDEYQLNGFLPRFQL